MVDVATVNQQQWHTNAYFFISDSCTVCGMNFVHLVSFAIRHILDAIALPFVEGLAF
jgi:hypothetical protein